MMTRRTFVGAFAAAALPATLSANPGAPVRALAFDAFPVFDPRPIAARVRALFPAQGERLAGIWTEKLFGYTWLSTAAEHYQDFEALADASLRFAADSVGVALADRHRAALVGSYYELDAWPDVLPALDRLRGAGIRLVLLSNLGEAMLTANMRNASIARFFEPPLSTDRVRRFKPAPAAYRMAMAAFGLPREEIGFCAFAGWDAAGAGWFGYRTAWINRTDAPAEKLDPRPAIIAPGIEGALALAGLV